MEAGGDGAKQSRSGNNDSKADRLTLSRPPKLEVAAYAVIVVVALSYFAYDFYVAYGIQPEAKLPNYSLRPGWLSKYRDNYDDSSLVWAWRHLTFLISTSIGYLIVSRVTLTYAPLPVHQLSCSFYTIAITCQLISWQATLYLIILYVLSLAGACCSVLCVWAVVIMALVLQNGNYSFFDILSIGGGTTEVFYPISGYYYCRLISLGHCLRRRGLQPSQLLSTLPISLHYSFYLPYHYVGPILTYDQFVAKAAVPARPISRSDLAWAAQRSCRLLLSLGISELLWHFQPVGAVLATIDTRPINYAHLTWAMYLYGQLFMLQYMQFYGWPGVMAKLDGVQLPDWPDCISRVYTYRQMWRSFDRGLFAIMHEHIYIPIGGNRHGWVRQALGIVLAFAFVCVYHGNTYGMRWWTGLNALQILIEICAISAYRSFLGSWLSKFLSRGVHSRFLVMMISWNLMTSSCTIFFFFFGTVGFIVTNELLWKPLTLASNLFPLLVFNFLAYCFVQLSMSYEQWKFVKKE